MASPLHDLDELVLKCRDKNAKSYIHEAVACYKAGAFRSAIVSTWVAVSFDILDKLKELSLAGDKVAEKQLNDFQKARKDGDIAASLKFERDILKVSRDQLELISHIEFIDLERLQQDRNRCAHPSMISDDDIFTPSAELARVHIRAAVDALLQYPPAQGKYALNLLLNTVDSTYFPTDEKKAIIAFRNTPLINARAGLVRNFIIVLIKKLVNENLNYKETFRTTTALNAIEYLHRSTYNLTLSDKLSSLLRTINDSDFEKLLPLSKKLNDFWSYLDEDIKQKLENYTENLPSNHIDELEYLLTEPNLRAAAIKRVKKITRNELAIPLFFDLPFEIAEQIVSLYTRSFAFSQANDFASTISVYAKEFTKEQVLNIIEACGKNSQIKDSRQLSSVLFSLRQNNNITKIEFDNALTKVQLSIFIAPETIDG